MSGVEYAGRNGMVHPFPARWGPAPAEEQSRAAWLAERVREEMSAREVRARAAEFASTVQGRPGPLATWRQRRGALTGAEALATLEPRRQAAAGPLGGRQARALLERRRYAPADVGG